MSVAFESNSSDRNRIHSSEFAPGMWINNLADTARFTGGNPWSSKLPVVKEEEDSSSSSIGNNSDASGGGGDSVEDDGEVQSANRGLLNALNALEEVFPIKRGLSTFYAGKSKSYGSLADASSAPSIQDIVKPEDAYTRKRKNMLAHSVLMGKNRNSIYDNGISKRLTTASRSTLALGCDSDGGSDSDESGERSNLNSYQAGLSFPPLPVNGRRSPMNGSPGSSARLYCSPWRSLSLSDLQHAAATSSVTGLIFVLCNKAKEPVYQMMQQDRDILAYKIFVIENSYSQSFK